MTLRLQRIRRVDLTGNELPTNGNRLVVWWYGPVVCQRPRAPSIPKVRVFFRRILEGGDLSGLFPINVGITHLGLLRLGSVWCDGTRESQIEYEQRMVTVSLDEGDFRFISRREAKIAERRDLLPQDEYALPYIFDQNFLLDLRVQDGGRLLIPCMEFFTRMYGRSAELRRVLAAYPWSEAEKQLYKPLKDDAVVPPGCWPIRLAKKMYNDDAVFLAHVQHDSYAREAAKSVYAQIEAACTRERYAFLKITPWHRGKISLIIEGKSLADGSFLGLRIQGFSDPDGSGIALDRENSALVDLNSRGARPEGAGQSKRISTSRRHPDILNLTEDDEPDQKGGSVEIDEDDIIRIGKPRQVVRMHLAHAQGPSETVGVRNPAESGTYSTGERSGTGKGVGRASLHTEVVLESEGHLRDVWVAAQSLQQRYPAEIQNVDWFTNAHGFQTSGEPKLIPLVPLKKKVLKSEQTTHRSERKQTTGQYSWALLDLEKGIPRGVLVFRFVVRGKAVYLVEIQQRHEKDKYSGLVFVLGNGADFLSSIATIIAEIPRVQGVMKKIIGRIPGVAKAFRHEKAKENPMMLPALVNALEKVGVTLDTPRKMKSSREIGGV